MALFHFVSLFLNLSSEHSEVQSLLQTKNQLHSVQPQLRQGVLRCL